MSSDAVMPEFADLYRTNRIIVEHAEFVVAQFAAATALRENGPHQC
jgi:hypothetical protein